MTSPLTLSLGYASSRSPAWEGESDRLGWLACLNFWASQMLILATVFQCLDPVLTMAACLSSKPVFLSPMDKRDEATASV
jgi:hypothetical protein